jgi:hypothetical protein
MVRVRSSIAARWPRLCRMQASLGVAHPDAATGRSDKCRTFFRDPYLEKHENPGMSRCLHPGVPAEFKNLHSCRTGSIRQRAAFFQGCTDRPTRTETIEPFFSRNRVRQPNISSLRISVMPRFFQSKGLGPSQSAPSRLFRRTHGVHLLVIESLFRKWNKRYPFARTRAALASEGSRYRHWTTSVVVALRTPCNTCERTGGAKCKQQSGSSQSARVRRSVSGTGNDFR